MSCLSCSSHGGWPSSGLWCLMMTTEWCSTCLFNPFHHLWGILKSGDILGHCSSFTLLFLKNAVMASGECCLVGKSARWPRVRARVPSSFPTCCSTSGFMIPSTVLCHILTLLYPEWVVNQNHYSDVYYIYGFLIIRSYKDVSTTVGTVFFGWSSFGCCHIQKEWLWSLLLLLSFPQIFPSVTMGLGKVYIAVCVLWLQGWPPLAWIPTMYSTSM